MTVPYKFFMELKSDQISRRNFINKILNYAHADQESFKAIIGHVNKKYGSPTIRLFGEVLPSLSDFLEKYPDSRPGFDLSIFTSSSFLTPLVSQSPFQFMPDRSTTPNPADATAKKKSPQPAASLFTDASPYLPQSANQLPFQFFPTPVDFTAEPNVYSSIIFDK